MLNGTLQLDEGQWSLARLSRLALVLAFCTPVLTVALGMAIGAHLERLGGAMIAFWAFALASLGLALVVARKATAARSREHYRWAIIVGTVIAIGPVLKGVPAVLHTKAVIPLEIREARPQTGQTNGCRPQLVSSDSNPVSAAKSGRSGNVAWLFWLGNYYAWHMEASIVANNRGTNGTASAVGSMSPWFSLLAGKRTAFAKAQGTIDCIADTAGCTCFAQSTRQTQADGEFTAKVVVSRAMTAGGADLEVATSAAVAGAPGAEVNLGGEAAGVKLAVPNTALDGIDESKSYSYRCSLVRP